MHMLLNSICRAFSAALLPALLLAGLSGCVARGPVDEVPVADTVEPAAAEAPADAEPAGAADEGAVADSDAPSDMTADVSPEGASPEPAVVTPQYSREDVIWIQQRLQELGYFEGQVDGVVGNRTTSAVRAYQRDQDIKADGRPTKKLREFMWRNGG